MVKIMIQEDLHHSDDADAGNDHDYNGNKKVRRFPHEYESQL